jgi:hypothetical protein
MKICVRNHMLALLVTTLALGFGAARADDGAWEKFKTFAHAQKKDAVAEGKRLMAETEKKIQALKKEARHSSAETKAAHEKNMADLEAKKKAAQAELARMEKAAAGAWGATQEGVSSAYRNLQEAYDKAAASAKS